ncbi:flagellar filament capping protein FliD [Novosphingobium taihuense]|uniref:Flagellar hook-associated protein 2 n=1 Tax=Novosphingobium taihuense TaxID=260085 RepID=A0A7W7ES46_9SPHN|nr:flagellar filament capping protein FliD [Novosphingobium taihuense]MBB4611822.1 flagellar hook-associated protein 2 [Novosphingobium taihuense]TWH88823.1 flagellar hook-associated protein 2 [Novosphingobium taihuense]
METTTSSTSSTSATAQIVSALGGGSGINTAQLAEQLAAAQFASRLDQLTAKSDKLTAQISSASNLKSLMSTLSSSIGTLIRTGDLAVKPSISNSSVATVSKGTATGSGTYSLEVTSLANAQKLVTPAYASSAATVGSGTLTLRFGTVSSGTFTADASRDQVDIAIPSGATLDDVAIAINSAKTGVTAYVANGTAGAQIVLKGQEGAANGFVIETTPDVGGEALADLAWTPASAGTRLKSTASDAAYRIDGIDYTSKSNTVTDIVPGLNMKLTATNVGNPATISFSDPSSGITTAMTDLVDALNEVVSQLNTAMDKTSGELNNDPGARALRAALTGLTSTKIMPNAASGKPSSLADLGLTIERDGTFSLDSTRLSNTLKDSPQEAGAMWTTGVYGVYAAIDKIARAASSTTAISLGSSITRYTALQKTATDKASELTDKQEALRQQLVSRFAAMDTRVSNSQSTLTFLQAQIAAWNSSSNN